MPNIKTALFTSNSNSSIGILRQTYVSLPSVWDYLTVEFGLLGMRILMYNPFGMRLCVISVLRFMTMIGPGLPIVLVESKATFICNPTLLYLHCLIANTIFTQQESQSHARLSEVFLIWCIQKDEQFDTGAFILHQLVSQDTLPKIPLRLWYLITTIADTCGLEPQLKQPLFQGGWLNLAACI